MIKTILIEDDYVSLLVLKKMLQDVADDIEIIGEAQSFVDAVNLLKNNKPDLVFLDIQLFGGDSFSLLEAIDDIDFDIIFVTSHEEHALKAIKLSAIDYIVKPIRKNELIYALEKYRLNRVLKASGKRYRVLKTLIEQKNEHSVTKTLVLPTYKEYCVVQVDEIIRCESSSYYTTFYLMDGRKIIVAKTLKEYEQLLQNDGFIRVHNSHLVNINRIIKIVKTPELQIVTEDNTLIPVSRRRKEILFEALKKYNKVVN